MPKKIALPIFTLFVLSCLLLMAQCKSTSQKQKATIGFSQCTMDDVWRVQMIQEMNREAEIINDIDFEILLKDAGNNTSQQEEDIRNLVNTGIDILIVSPNQAYPLRNIIDSVSQLNIPVILIDRFVRTDSTLYLIGANNYNIGKMAGQEALRLLPKGGNVLIFSGLKGSTPATHRQKGFSDVVKENKATQITNVKSDWTENTAYKQMQEIIESNANFDLIFTHNDFMARGVIKALKQHKKKLPPIIGIDGLNAPDCGIDMILDSLLAATITYPTGGDVAIQTAYKITTQQSAKSNITLNSILITPDNVKTIKLQRDEIEQQYSKIDRQNVELANKEDEIIIQKRRKNRTILVLLVSLVLLTVHFYLLRKKNAKNADILETDEAQYKIAIPINSKAKPDEKQFIEAIENLVKEYLNNTDLSVQFVGEKLGMSHSTVYRKIKKLTGLTSVELIKLIRLNNAAELLRNSSLSVEEIAFQCGFNTASYFSTSFVKQFGVSPAKFRKE